MQKKIRLSWFMLFVFMLTIFGGVGVGIPQASAANLSDIQGHWAATTIQSMVDQGIITGYPDGTFKPDNIISRAEFAVLLVKTFKLESKSGKVFSDTEQHWAKDYIATANAYGIVNGYSDVKFGPDDPITREQMARMVVKAANLQSSSAVSSFTDSANISAWAKDAVAIASANKIINGYPDGSFQPLNGATRAEAVVVLSNAQQLVQTPATPETATTVATVTASPVAGAVALGTTIALSCATSGANIYYTVDGSDPTTSSTLYSVPISITAATTIKAFAAETGYTSSAVASYAYTIAIRHYSTNSNV